MVHYERMLKRKRSLPFFLQWIYWFSLRYQVLSFLYRYNSFRKHFIDQNDLSDKFHFYRYLKRSAKDLFSEWAVVHWSCVGIVFGIQFLIWVAITTVASDEKGVAFLVITAVGFLWFSLFYYHISDVYTKLSKDTSLIERAKEDPEDPHSTRSYRGETTSKKSDSDHPIDAPAGVFDPFSESSDEHSDHEESKDHHHHHDKHGKKRRMVKRKKSPSSHSDDQHHALDSSSTSDNRGRNRKKTSSSGELSFKPHHLKSSTSGIPIPSPSSSAAPSDGEDNAGEGGEKDHQHHHHHNPFHKLQSVVSFVTPSMLHASSRTDFYEAIEDASVALTSSDSSIISDSWDESWTSESSWYSSSDSENDHHSKDPFNPSLGSSTALGSSSAGVLLPSLTETEFEEDATPATSSHANKDHHHHHHHHHHHRVHHHHKPRQLIPTDLEFIIHYLIPFLMCRITIFHIIKGFKNQTRHRKLFWFRSPAITLYISQFLLFYQASLVSVCICAIAGLIDMEWYFIVASAILIAINTFYFLPSTVYKFSLSLSVGEFTDHVYIEEVNITAYKKARKHLLTRSQIKNIRNSVWNRSSTSKSELPLHPRELLRRSQRIFSSSSSSPKKVTESKDPYPYPHLSPPTVPSETLPAGSPPPASDPIDIV